MKRLLLIFLITGLSGFSNNVDWGHTGHKATGEIAEKYLSRKAKKEIRKLLRGKNLALVSTYADEIKSDPEFSEYGPWHYVNIPKGKTKYTDETAAEEGDLLKALRKCVAVLQDESSFREEKEFHLAMLIHFVGDLHQPLHTGRGEDKGGNNIRVRWFNESSNLHRVWDSAMINSCQMSYSELAGNVREFSGPEVKQIAAGNFEDWMYESAALSEKVYKSVEIGENLGYRYMYDWFPVVKEQLQKGGIRLAMVLNEIFDES